MHADFLRVDEKQAITVKVPLHFINEDKCVGVKLGSGSIRKTLNEIEISCLPSNLPEYIEVDMLEVEVGQTLHISDIALPEGVTSVALSHGEDSDLSIAQVQAPRGGGDARTLRMLRMLARMTLLQMIQVTAPIARPNSPAR